MDIELTPQQIAIQAEQEKENQKAVLATLEDQLGQIIANPEGAASSPFQLKNFAEIMLGEVVSVRTSVNVSNLPLLLQSEDLQQQRLLLEYQEKLQLLAGAEQQLATVNSEKNLFAQQAQSAIGQLTLQQQQIEQLQQQVAVLNQQIEQDKNRELELQTVQNQLQEQYQTELQRQLAITGNEAGQALAEITAANQKLQARITVEDEQNRALIAQQASLQQQIELAQKAQAQAQEEIAAKQQLLIQQQEDFSKEVTKVNAYIEEQKNTNEKQLQLALQTTEQERTLKEQLKKEADTAVDQLLAQLALANQKVESTESQLAVLEQNDQTLAQQLKSCQESLDTAKQDRENEREQALQQIEQLQRNTQRLALEAQQASAELDQLQLVTLSSVDESVRQALARNQVLEANLNNTSNTLALTEQQLADQETRNNALQIQLKTIAQQNEANASALVTIQSTAQAKERELALVKKNADESERKYVSELRLTKQLDTERDQLGRQLAQMTANMKEAKRRESEANSQIIALKQQINNSQELVQKQSLTSSEAQLEATRLQATVQRKDAQIEALRQQNDQLIADMKKQREAAQKTLRLEQAESQKLISSELTLTTTLKKSADLNAKVQQLQSQLDALTNAMSDIQLYALSNGRLVSLTSKFTPTDPANKQFLRLPTTTKEELDNILMLYNNLRTLLLYKGQENQLFVNFLQEDPQWKDKYYMISQAVFNLLRQQAIAGNLAIAGGGGEMIPKKTFVTTKKKAPIALIGLGQPFKALNVLEAQTQQNWEARNNQLKEPGLFTVDVQFSGTSLDDAPRLALHFEVKGVHLFANPSEESKENDVASYFVQLGHNNSSNKMRTISLGSLGINNIIYGKGFGRIRVKNTKTDQVVKEEDFAYEIAPQNEATAYNTPMSAALTPDIMIYAHYLGSRMNTYKLDDIVIAQ